MPISAETSEQDVQTEEWTQENGVSTDEDWLLILRNVKEESDVLAAEWKSLEEKQAADEVEHNARLKSLEKMKEEKNRQYRALLDKIDSMRDKLDLNNSKKMRKNFTANIEKLSAEKERHLEAKRRLAQDLEEAEKKLKTLTEEQQNEKLSLEAEIAALQREKQTVSKLADEANQTALKDEMAAVESQKELAISQVEDWIADAEKYLLALRSETSPQHNRQRLEWQKNVAMVRSGMTKLQESYNENLKLLLKGQQLDSLPTIPLPSLPTVPTMPLVNPVIRPAVPQPQFHPTHRVTGPPVPAAPLHNPVHFPPHILDHSPRLPMPVVVRGPITPYVHGSQAPGYAPVSTATAHVGVPAGLPTAPTQNPTAQALLPNPQPVGKLDKLLEKLGTQFPQCTRLQLTRVLQQIKNERGTMAGMSIDDIKQQVELKLAQHERPPPGPIAPPSGSRHFSGPPQRGQPMRPPVQAPGPHVFPSRGPQVTNTVAPAVRKLCLMCQNHVEPGTQYNTNCLHTLHKECISVWLQTSKNNSCPFCPSK